MRKRKTYIRHPQSYYSAIGELTRSNNINGLVKLVSKMAKTVNQKFYRLEKAGVQSSSQGYNDAAAYLDKDKPRFSTSESVLARMHPDDLIRYANDINHYHLYADTTVSGVIDINERRFKHGLESLQKNFGIDINEDEFKEFLNIGGAEFLNSKHLDSAQVIEDFVEFTRNGNISGKEFLREFKRYRAKLGQLSQEDAELFNTTATQLDYAKIKRNLTNLSNRKKAKKK